MRRQSFHRLPRHCPDYNTLQNLETLIRLYQRSSLFLNYLLKDFSIFINIALRSYSCFRPGPVLQMVDVEPPSYSYKALFSGFLGLPFDLQIADVGGP